MSKVIVILFALLAPVLPAIAQNDAADKITGIYYVSDDTSEEDCKVKIYKDKSGTYSGRIIWVKNPTFKDGSPKRDIMNPDPAKRNTPGDQIPLVFHFKYDPKKNQWVDGAIYDPIHGKTYKCKMWFDDDKTLRVRGYIGVPALGRTMTWKKL